MYLTDDEFADLLRDLVAVLAPRIAQQPAAGRTRRLLSTIVMPS
jgi:hypothetical protein